jgi:hypothetical protein
LLCRSLSLCETRELVEFVVTDARQARASEERRDALGDPERRFTAHRGKAAASPRGAMRLYEERFDA